MKNINGDISMINDVNIDEQKIINMHNQVLDDYSKQLEESMKTPEDIVSRAANLDIMPINNYVLIKPYDKNPYQKIEVSDTGIITSSPSSGKFMNPDTGEEDTADMWSRFGTVIECSPNNKMVKVGDDVMYRSMQAIPIPFLKLGLEVVAETSILVVINENLKQRFYGRE